MARPLRLEYPGAVYHVTSRGNQGNVIFRNDAQREEFLKVIADTGRRYNWICHAYCLMDNHYHLILETPDGNLSKAMRQVNAVYTQYFNRDQRTGGHLFQGRYKAILIEKDSHLLEAIRYVVLNPVRAGIVSSADIFCWSSYRATCGFHEPHPCLEGCCVHKLFDDDQHIAALKFSSFVADGVDADNPFLKARGQAVLGTDSFWQKLKPVLAGKSDSTEIPRSQRMLARPQLSDLFAAAGKEARNGSIHEAVERWGYSQKEIADFLGLHYSSISRILKEKVPAPSPVPVSAPVVAVTVKNEPSIDKPAKMKTPRAKRVAEKKEKDVKAAIADQLSLF